MRRTMYGVDIRVLTPIAAEMHAKTSRNSSSYPIVYFDFLKGFLPEELGFFAGFASNLGTVEKTCVF
jgi:hypothetical protein